MKRSGRGWFWHIPNRVFYSHKVVAEKTGRTSMPVPELQEPELPHSMPGGEGAQLQQFPFRAGGRRGLRGELEVFLACSRSMRILLVANMI